MVALCLAVAALGVSVVVIRHSGSATAQPSERQLLAMQSAALGRLKLPDDFVPLSRGCTTDRCYLVAAPASDVTRLMPTLLRSAGIQPAGSLRAAEPVGLLKLAHWSTDSRDPLVIACKAIDTPAQRELSTCQDGGRVGQTLVNVLVKPYEPCNRQACTESGTTEVLTWATAFPSGVH